MVQETTELAFRARHVAEHSQELAQGRDRDGDRLRRDRGRGTDGVSYEARTFLFSYLYPSYRYQKNVITNQVVI